MEFTILAEAGTAMGWAIRERVLGRVAQFVAQ